MRNPKKDNEKEAKRPTYGRNQNNPLPVPSPACVSKNTVLPFDSLIDRPNPSRRNSGGKICEHAQPAIFITPLPLDALELAQGHPDAFALLAILWAMPERDCDYTAPVPLGMGFAERLGWGAIRFKNALRVLRHFNLVRKLKTGGRGVPGIYCLNALATAGLDPLAHVEG